MKQHLATIHSQQMYSTWSEKCVADIWNKSSGNYHLFHWGRDKLASFDCSFNLHISPLLLRFRGNRHSLRLSLICRMGVYRFLDVRPSEVVVSTVLLFLSPCCTGLDWWRKISTSDLTQQREDRGREARGQKDKRNTTDVRRIVRKIMWRKHFLSQLLLYFRALSKSVQSNPTIENNAVLFHFDLFVNLLKPQSHLS